MTTSDPLALLNADRAAARANADPMANLCVLATVGDGEPEARTLVLRDVEARIAVFFNATSPKAAEIGQSTTAAVLVYLPSLSLQYRLRTRLVPIPTPIVHANWQFRPEVPKRMDWFYERHPQSSVIIDRGALVSALSSGTPPESAPGSAIGYYLAPEVVERLDIGQDNGVHDRRRYTWRHDTWAEQVLVP